MRIRRIAVLIDGGFFVKKLPRLVPLHHRDTPAAVAQAARFVCKRHVQRLSGEPFATQHSKWLDHVYRLFYYDATPYEGIAHHPLLNQQVHFSRTEEAVFRRELFREIRRMRKFALRLGHVAKEDGWKLTDAQLTKKLLRMRDWVHVLDAAIEQSQTDVSPLPLSPDDIQDLQRLASAWKNLREADVRLGLRQKGVDMRIGLDISTLTLKKQVDTIVLVTGDSDFVPAAKLARREGVEFILDPLWQSVSDDLYEHVDGVISALRRPESGQPGDDELMITDND